LFAKLAAFEVDKGDTDTDYAKQYRQALLDEGGSLFSSASNFA
jgi:hypothetical protein